MKDKDLALMVFNSMIPDWKGTHFVYFYYDKDGRRMTIKVYANEIIKLIENKIKLSNL